jgi:hypothetical protein
MGLFLLRFSFDSPPPSEQELRAELARQIGTLDGLDSVAIDGGLVELTTLLEPVTAPYAVKVLLDFGGTQLDIGSGAPRPSRLPDYVSQPWPSLPWWKRASIHARFQLALLSTALPGRRRKAE